MGFYRLVLAFMVVASHMDLTVYHYNLGVVAVISFFLLSGYVMSALITKNYASASRIPAFYLDRLARIGPQFYLYSFLTLGALLALNMHHGWMTARPEFANGLAQFALVPLNFYRHFPSMFLPQAWSLGLEATFYMIFPFVLLHGIRLPTALLSCIVFTIAIGGWIDTDLYAYRFLPGTLFIFICGSWLHDVDQPWQRTIPYIVAFFAFVVLGFSYWGSGWGDTAYSRPILLGLGLGVPFVALTRSKFVHSRWNTFAGDLSYGVFLNHVLIIGMLETTSQWKSNIPGTWHIVNVFLVCVLACCASYMSFHLVEAPLIACRRRLRSASRRETEPNRFFPAPERA